jgi:hypothetical protein
MSIAAEDPSPAVMAEIARLGGTLAARAERAEPTTVATVCGPRVVPEPLRRFLEDVRWPSVGDGNRARPAEFRGRHDDYPRGLVFGLTEIAEDYSRDGDARPYLAIGDDRTQVLYFIDLESPDPGDPLVFRVDHEGDWVRNEGDELPLSELLASLRLEDPPPDGTALVAMSDAAIEIVRGDELFRRAWTNAGGAFWEALQQRLAAALPRSLPAGSRWRHAYKLVSRAAVAMAGGTEGVAWTIERRADASGRVVRFVRQL